MLQYREVKILSINEKITVREDGNEILYKGKNVHLSLVKSKSHRYGFYQISIEGKRVYVHKIVAEAFVPNTQPVSYKMILHKDWNTINNHYKNLEWGNRKKFNENRIKNGNQTMSEAFRGSSKITYQEAINISKRLESGELAKNICIEYNVSEMSISRIRKRYLKNTASKRFPSEIKETVLRLLLKHRAHELVAITGLKYHTLYRWNKEILNASNKTNP